MQRNVLYCTVRKRLRTNATRGGKGGDPKRRENKTYAKNQNQNQNNTNQTKHAKAQTEKHPNQLNN